jgi:hypothetical protein
LNTALKTFTVGFMDGMERARAIAKQAAAHFNEARAAVQVERWEWATGPYRPIEPAFFEVRGITQADFLDDEPAEPRVGTHAYGLDDVERVVLERVFAADGRVLETVQVHEDLTIVSHTVDSACVYTFDDRGLLSQSDRAEVSGAEVTERFEYDGDERIWKVHREGNRAPGESFVISRDDLGRISAVDRTRQGAVERVFTRPF